MTLKTWNSLLDKQKWFEYKKIDSKEELDGFISGYECCNNLFFRGVNDASFKLYSSIQRFWDAKGRTEPFDEFIEKSIRAVKKYSQVCGISFPMGDLTILSFLQHYGYPTPLLDFTIDFTTSLFFAVDKMQPGNSSNQCSEYVSIYAVNQNQEDLCNFRVIISQNAFVSPASLNKYSVAKAWKTIILTNDNDAGKGDFKLGLNTNKNINAQKGLFILNPNLEQVLDEVFNGETFDQFAESGPDVQFHGDLFFGKVKCWDINKKLVKEIKSYLTKKGVDSSKIYPDCHEHKIEHILSKLKNKLV